jgi:hypothetical protein
MNIYLICKGLNVSNGQKGMNALPKAGIRMEGKCLNAEGIKGINVKVRVTSEGKVKNINQNDISLFLMSCSVYYHYVHRLRALSFAHDF